MQLDLDKGDLQIAPNDNTPQEEEREESRFVERRVAERGSKAKARMAEPAA